MGAEYCDLLNFSTVLKIKLADITLTVILV